MKTNNFYTIKEGDTLESIAKENNMELKELIDLNKIVDRKKLGIGNILKIKGNNNKDEK